MPTPRNSLAGSTLQPGLCSGAKRAVSDSRMGRIGRQDGTFCTAIRQQWGCEGAGVNNNYHARPAPATPRRACSKAVANGWKGFAKMCFTGRRMQLPALIP